MASRSDATLALVMAALFLSFGLFAILRSEKLRAAMDNFANSWKQGEGIRTRMPIPFLRSVVGSAGIGGSALFLLYIAYIGLTR